MAYSEHTPVEHKRHKKHEKHQWRLQNIVENWTPGPVCRKFGMIFKFNLTLVFPSKNRSTILSKNCAYTGADYRDKI